VGDHGVGPGGVGEVVIAGPLERALHAALTADPPDPAAVEAARLALVQKCDKFAWKQAKRWHRRHPWTDEDDWHGYAVLGLWEAVRRFDPTKGNGFSTYGQHYMRKHCQRAAQVEAADGLHVPMHHGVKRVAVTAFGSVTAEGGEGDLAAAVAERVTDPADLPPDEAEFWDQVGWMLGDDRKLMVLKGRYAEDRRLDDIARDLGVSRERVRQLQVKAEAELTAERELLAELLAG
jgi:RNA polymerase sigma factor (sigma-70 family)